MKTVSLNLSERYFATSILNTFKGSLEDQALLDQDFLNLNISKEEWEKGEQKIIKETKEIENEDGTKETKEVVTEIRWDNEKGGLKDVELSDKASEYIHKSLSEKTDFDRTDPALMHLMSLKNKLT